MVRSAATGRLHRPDPRSDGFTLCSRRIMVGERIPTEGAIDACRSVCLRCFPLGSGSEGGAS